MSKCVAFIHARGGSKRIPRKNIKDFCGKPAISYPIETALNTGVFDEVIISTDDAEIADIAVKYGAKQYYVRPANLSNDIATTDEVFQYDIKTMREKGCDFDHACCIYGTSIFLEETHINQACKIFAAHENAKSVISVTEYDFPIYRALIKNDVGQLVMREPEYLLTRSQDLPDTYHDAAQFYFLKVDDYLKNKKIYADNGLFSVEIPNSKVIDIDTPEDWIKAEGIYKTHYRERNEK
tara:strand:- start:539 stop:1252 length:714 start_codon:yes stop_codon:yes gene_type:complete